VDPCVSRVPFGEVQTAWTDTIFSPQRTKCPLEWNIYLEPLVCRESGMVPSLEECEVGRSARNAGLHLRA
jgi:hypothetical protein